jgi:hypothetical protein
MVTGVLSRLLIQIEKLLRIIGVLAVKPMMLAGWSSLTKPLPVPAHAKPARRKSHRLRKYIKNPILKSAMQSLRLLTQRRDLLYLSDGFG